jgi:hypothetical protein
MKIKITRLSTLIIVFLFTGNLKNIFAQLPCTVQAVMTGIPGGGLTYSLNAYLTGDSVCSSASPQYVWSIYGNPNVTLTGQAVNHTFSAPGTYYICVQANYLGISSSFCDTLIVQQQGLDCTPAIVVNTQGLNASLSISGQVPSACFNGNTVYNWSFGDSTFATVVGNAGIDHTYPASGTYTACVSAAAANGQIYSSCVNVTVNMFQGPFTLAGMILAGGACLAEPVLVECYGLGNNYYQSMTINGAADSCYYYFQTPFNAQPAQYLIRATPLQSNQWLPTYYGDALFWTNATLVGPVQNNYSLHINLIPDFAGIGTGTGNVSGNISGLGTIVNTQVSGSNISTPFQASACRVVLLDSNNQPLGFSGVNSSGNYAFANLPEGNYSLRADHPAVPGTSIPFNLTSGNLSASINFGVTGSGLSVLTAGERQLKKTKLHIWPNPAETELNLYGGQRLIRVFNSEGRMVLEESEKNKLDVAGLPAGLYHLHVIGQDGLVKTAEFLRK